MIVRTYARRSRGSGGGGGNFSEPLTDFESSEIDDSQEFSLSQSHGPFDFSSQDSDLFLPLPSSPKAPLPELQSKNRRRARDREAAPAPAPAATATLMEAQEFGEMMEHVDEANFALDGLRRGQPARIRRASLLSLLAICGTPQRRRLLRARGMTKRIIDAILALNFDDSPSTVAAAALFFVLAIDVQDDHLLDSPACVQFLIKLLDPKLADTIKDQAPAIGSKLLGIINPQVVIATNKGMDSSSRKIISQVQEILFDCKEIKSCSQDEDGVRRPELSSKWISLLTMEKACLSTVSFEDTCETVRRVGGNFKERLRELGGLDAIFDVIVSCHSTMKKWSKHQTSVPEFKDGESMESVVLLLKCLKIMENATFLSKDNQGHLLNMRGKLNAEGLCPSFAGIVISCIKFLSGLSLLQGPTSISSKGDSTCFIENVYTHNRSSQSQKKETEGDNQDLILTAEDVISCGIDDSLVKRTKASHRRQNLADSSPELSVSGSEMTVDVYSSEEKADSHSFGFIDEALSGSNGGSYLNANGLKVNINSNRLKVNIKSNGLKVNSGNFGKGSDRWISIRAIGQDSNSHVPSKATGSKSNIHRPFKRPHMSQDVNCEFVKDSFDPFAFDEESEPSKWEKGARNKETSQMLQSEVTNKGHAKGYEILNLAKDPSSSQSTNGDSQTLETDFPSIIEEDTDLMEDCLLTSVKVLMNLTNDNPEGCQQIAACGGLDTMATLIISHFPSFDLCSPICSQLKEDIPSSSQNSSAQLNDKHLSDRGLDFLVAILGLLVNLVEKDSRNRLRLASARVFLERPGSSGSAENQRDVIPLLCSIFLANQGAGEAAGEQRLLQCDDESSLMQGEREAEMMIIEAYAALLLAFLSTESAKVWEAIARCLPNHNLQALVPVLERFVAFHLTLNMISPETHSLVTKVIEACKGP